MAGQVAISILANARQAVSEIDSVARAVNSTEERLDAAGRAASEWADKADFAGGAAAKMAGGVGDVGDGLAAMGFVSQDTADKFGEVQKSMMLIAGAADIATTAAALYTAAQEAGGLAAARNAVATVASNAATVASSAVAKTAAAAQWLLNAALAANPIGLVVIAIALLVAGLIYAYTHSEKFRAIVDGAMRAVGAAFVWLWNSAKAVFGWLADNWRLIAGILTGPFLGMVPWFSNIGTQIMRGLSDGISAGLKWVRDKVTGLGNLIPGWLKSVLGIRSPSRVMAGLGRNIVQGLGKGISDQLPALKRQLGTVSATVTSGLSASPSVDLSSTGRVALEPASASSGRTYVLNVNVPVGADLAETGRQIVRAVEAHERQSGRTRLVAAL